MFNLEYTQTSPLKSSNQFWLASQSPDWARPTQVWMAAVD